MAYGLHWEWRGFGAVTHAFVRRFCALPELTPEMPYEDVYIWIPNLDINTKYRESEAEAGLKFKRPVDQDGDLEQWREDEGEIFEFPLHKTAWETLAAALEEGGLDIGPYPADPPDRAQTVTVLKEIGCKTVRVDKSRASRLWTNARGRQVKVEWASISAPQLITSIGLESWEGPEGAEASDEGAIESLKEAVDELGLDREPLAVLNYLDILGKWASGAFITHRGA